MKSIIKFITSILLFITPFNASNLTPDEQKDAEYGKRAFENFLKSAKLSSDREKFQEVKEVGLKIAKASGKDYNWEFALVEDNSINAFCIPGGKIVVFTGLFKVVENRDQLAAVMAHEVSHALSRHGIMSERLNILLNIPKEVGRDILGELIPREMHSTLDKIYDLGKKLTVMLPFSRYQEVEADKEGIYLMYKAGFDINETVKLWENMKKYSSNNRPEFLSTHPNHDSRIENIKREIEKIESK